VTALWPNRARAVWLAMVAAGGLVCALGWRAASAQAAFADQTRWSSLSVAGLLLAFSAHVGWFLAGRRAIGRRQVELLGDPDAPTGDGPAVGREAVGGRVVAGADLRRFHRPGCPMTAGRSWPVLDAASLAGREPCGICRPEQP
jgi:hypothetical protein